MGDERARSRPREAQISQNSIVEFDTYMYLSSTESIPVWTHEKPYRRKPARLHCMIGCHRSDLSASSKPGRRFTSKCCYAYCPVKILIQQEEDIVSLKGVHSSISWDDGQLQSSYWLCPSSSHQHPTSSSQRYHLASPPQQQALYNYTESPSAT